MEGKKVVLHYFGLNGLGALARILLKYGNIEFENKKYSFEDWATARDNFDFKFMPVLEVDGVQYSQSIAVYFYIARKIGNLLGKSDEDEQAILAVLSTWSDFGGAKIINIIWPKGENATPEKIKENTEILTQSVVKIAQGLEKLYTRHGSGKYFLGSSISVADFYLANLFGHYFPARFPEIYEEFKKAAPGLSQAISTYTTEEPFVALFESDLYIKGADI